MKYFLGITLSMMFCFSGHTQSVESYSLKNINEIFVRAFLTEGEDFGVFADYLTEYEIRKVVEKEFMNSNITIGDNEEKAKFVFDVRINYRKFKDNMIMDLEFELGEQVLLKRINEYIYAYPYQVSALGIMPNRYDAIDHVKTLIKESTNDFIHELKKDNQK